MQMYKLYFMLTKLFFFCHFIFPLRSPMLQHREMSVVHCPSLGVALIFGVGHIFDEKIEQRIFGLVGEIAVGVAPFAILLVETAVGIEAHHRIVRERHSTALAKQCLRRAEQGVDCNAKLLGEGFEHFGVGLSFACLPTTYRLTCGVYALRHLLLREVVFFAEILQNFFYFHNAKFLLIIDTAKLQRQQMRVKKHVVAFC